MSEPCDVTRFLFNVFVVIPAITFLVMTEFVLVVTALYRLVRWVERKWWK